MDRVLGILRDPFWQGFIAGVLFAILVRQLAALLPWLFKAIRRGIQKARERAIIGIGVRLRKEVFQWSQQQHLSAMLFPLDEILIQPRILAPPVSASAEEAADYFSSDLVTLTIPYLPDWPEMAALYGASTLSLPEALEGGANLILLGRPGMGKTVALASLASLIARRDPSAGKLAGHIPLMVHIADLLPKLKGKKTPTLIEALCSAVAVYTSKRTLAQLPGFLKNYMGEGKVILIVDGYDEASQDDQKLLNGFLENLLQAFPNLRLIISAIPGSYSQLNQIGLIPVALAAWSEADRKHFIKNWLKKWPTAVPSAEESTAPVTADPLLLESWLSVREISLNPLELTLKVWGALAGDLLGPEIPTLLESHIRRLTVGISDASAVLERLTIQMIIRKQPVVTEREASSWVSKFERLSPTAGKGKKKMKASAQLSSAVSDTLYQLENCGILQRHNGNTLRMAHSVFMFYLAGNGFAKSGLTNILTEQDDWYGKYETLAFVGCFGDVTLAVQEIMGNDQEPTHFRSLQVGRWLRLAPKNAVWRNLVMRYLLEMFQKEAITLGMSGRILSALALSGDPGISTLFRQFVKAHFSHIKHLGALGCGMVFDAKAVNDLDGLFLENDPILGGAACLALVAIHTKDALETVMSLLLHGSETLRRAAAEALANDEEEGFAALEEGATLPDLLVRRAVVYGLTRVNQPWAVALLEKMEIEDSQWVVRTAATQALEDLRKPKPGIPKPTLGLTEQAWLVEYAAKRGMGIAPGKPALDMLVSALENGDARERIQSLDYFRLAGIDGYMPQLYKAYYGGQAVLRETAFNTLWHFAAAGIPLPPAIQFGFG